MSVFKFKQFDIDQSGCAMKINTDGVLLAAMAEADHPSAILDVGTGTGVIALMLAQRFTGAVVHAVEIDEVASITAGRNFGNSIFADRLFAHHADIQYYEPCLKFDLIISNPPFFVNDLKNAEKKKGIARHTDDLFFDQLVVKVASLLSDEGRFWFILPLKQADLLVAKAEMVGLWINQLINLHSDHTKPAFRRLICLKRSTNRKPDREFYIYQSEKVHTLAYRTLLKDFFLKL